jgi:2-methylisocitrate lyase-like PEP mutase family enzyme
MEDRTMPASQAEKAERFRELHRRAGAFVMPNPWDAGSARVLAGLGFEALATSSGACAGTLGRRDGAVTREETLAHARAIVEATELPVSADLERCFADDPAGVAETIRLAADVGLVGGSVEDATGRPEQPLYGAEEAAARVRAAAEAARGLGVAFVLTARTENFVRGNPDLGDTIARLRAYEAAGAEVLMAPGLPDLEAVRAVCAALSRPFNFMAGIKGRSFPVAELAAAGVKRVSLATSLYRAAMTGLVEAAREVKEQGSFGYVEASLPTAEINRFML